MEKDEQLIEAVRGFPCLYNSKSPDFKVALNKENAWSAVAASLNKDGEKLYIIILDVPLHTRTLAFLHRQCSLVVIIVLLFLLHSPNAVCEIQKRWKTLRERFVREVKSKKTKSGQGAKSPVPWELLSLLEFLRDFVKHRKLVQNTSYYTCERIRTLRTYIPSPGQLEICQLRYP